MLYIDVSHYDWDRNQGNLDWNLIKSNGIDVVFIRASYGDPLTYNPQTRYFKEMALAAKAAGLKVGGYHNVIHGDFASIQRQVAYFKQELDSVNADYAMADIEPYDALKLNDLWPRLSDAELFAQEFRNQDHYRKLAIYLPQWVWSGYMNRADLQPLMSYAKGTLVSSNYPLGTTRAPFDQLYVQAGGDNGPGWKPYGNVTPEVWQYSSNAIVPGATPPTDANAYKGTAEEFDSRMAWVLTRNLQAFRDQMNEFFPDRDKASDGTIGDAAHAAGKSGHNPDDSEFDNAECDSDADTKSEVRAIDIDDDLNYPGITMEMIVQHLLKLAKSDGNFPIKYMIYNKRIWSASSDWVQKTYTGASPHTEHLHLSGVCSDKADENYYNYRLDDLMALTADDKEFIASFFKPGVQSDGKSVTSPVGNVTFNQGIPNGVRGTKTYAWQAITDIGNSLNAVTDALKIVLQKVDIDPVELQSIKDALDVPTAEENADAVVEALGGVDIDNLASTLRNSLTSDQIAALKAAL